MIRITDPNLERKIRTANELIATIGIDDLVIPAPADTAGLSTFYVPTDRLEEAMETGMFINPADKRNRHERRRAKKVKQ